MDDFPVARGAWLPIEAAAELLRLDAAMIRRWVADLAAVRSERLAVGPRLSTPGIRDALEAFDTDRLEREIQAAQEEVNRRQQATIDELRAAIEDARAVNSRLLAEVRDLRASVNRI